MCTCELTRGDYINLRAYTGSQIVTLRAQIPELEKQARKTPPKTLLVERAKVERAQVALDAAKKRLVELEKDYEGWCRMENWPMANEGGDTDG